MQIWEYQVKLRKSDEKLSVQATGLTEKLASDQKKVFNLEKYLINDRQDYLKFKKDQENMKNLDELDIDKRASTN